MANDLLRISARAEHMFASLNPFTQGELSRKRMGLSSDSSEMDDKLRRFSKRRHSHGLPVT
jgi:hypothetical protein